MIRRLCIIGVLIFYVKMTDMTHNSIKDIIASTMNHIKYMNAYNQSIIKVYDNNCDCIKYDCGCCQFVEWDVISLNGTLCANASYLEYDYGISITVTYNNLAIINETITARNPPPVCIGEDVASSIKCEICLRVFDIDIGPSKFHACFEILGKVMDLKIAVLRLGCINTKLYKKIKNIENSTMFPLSQLFYKKRIKNSMPPSVIMV